MSDSIVTIGISKPLVAFQVWNVACGLAKVELELHSRAILAERRTQIISYVRDQQTPAYGFNRGFGHNVDNAVAPENLAELQQNLIRSHSSGVGESLPKDVVRAAMLLRAQSMAQGHSGVRAEVVEKIVELLNAGITPHVPKFGSVGASGDLAPLSHMALALIGEGQGFDIDSSVLEPISSIFSRRNIIPLTLQMKEGLALNNGVQFSNAAGLLAAIRLRDLLKTAVAATALSSQVMLGSDSAYDEKLLSLRPHLGIQVVGGWLRRLIKDSPLREVHRPYEVDGEIQDPYNLRCAPQILGTCYDLIEEAILTFEIEANSVTDNPLVLADEQNPEMFTRIVSGGHFHGMPVAVKLYNLMQAMGIMARLSNMRCERYVDQSRNKGLPSDLIWPKLTDAIKATSSGMMIPEYVSAALTNAIWGAAMPSHLFSLSTDAGQEDHVSMSATLAVRVLETIPRLAEVLAIELAFGAQAASIRKEQATIPSKLFVTKNDKKVEAIISDLEHAVRDTVGNPRFEPAIQIKLEYKVAPPERNLSPTCEKLVKAIQKSFPTVIEDRELSSGLSALSERVSSSEILRSIPESCFELKSPR